MIEACPRHAGEFIENPFLTSHTAMLFITTAMQPEARPLIAALGLKKNHAFARFRIYDSPECALIVSGTGKIRSAVATTFLLTSFNASKNDFYINSGVCGAVDKNIKTGSIFLINSIRDHETRREMFPDMLYHHDFQEDAIETFSAPVTADAKKTLNTRLVDMEAAGAFEAARLFLPMHRMAIIKVALDYLKPGESDRRDVEKAMNKAADQIIRWLETIPCKKTRNERKEETETWASALFQESLTRMDMSRSLRIEFAQMMKYLEHADPEGRSHAACILSGLLKKPGRITRREAKKIISTLRGEVASLPLHIFR